MKKLIIMSAVAISGLIYQNASAQIGLHVNINLGARPVVMAPAPVYDEDYYYLPEVEAYYSVNQHCYYYQDGGSWISAAYLPGRYHDFDWRTSSHYAIRESRPYLHNDVYRSRYGGFEGRRDWNNRDERSSQRVYADRDRFDHNNNRGGNYGGGFNRQQQSQQNDNRGGFGGRGNNQQQSQPQQQNGNRSGGYQNGGQQQQQQQPQGGDRGGNHGNDNNRGGNDNRQGRRG
jgi:hypothetical protein